MRLNKNEYLTISDALKMTEINHKDLEDKCKLKILTWNINGIRSFDDFQNVLQNTDADIICIQETKVM